MASSRSSFGGWSRKLRRIEFIPRRQKMSAFRYSFGFPTEKNILAVLSEALSQVRAGCMEVVVISK